MGFNVQSMFGQSGQWTRQGSNQTQTSAPDAIGGQARGQTFQTANDLLWRGPYNGQTLADQSPATTGAWGMQQQGANRVGASAQGAANTMGNIANGGAANPFMDRLANGFGGANMNPYLDSLYGAASKPVINDINAQFAKSGRVNSDAHAGAMTRELGNVAANIYAPAYEAERSRELSGLQSAGSLYDNGVAAQQRSASLLPSLWEGIMAPGNTMANIGAQQDAYAQKQIDDRQQQYYAPWDLLSQYAQIMGQMPNYGTTSTYGSSRGQTLGVTHQDSGGFQMGLGGGG